MNIGDRLRSERERLGYSQEKLAAVGGVQKRAQINYEAGARQPDAAYLRGIAQLGVDLQYVLVGVRSANLMEVMLSDDFVSESGAENARAAIAGLGDRVTPPDSVEETALLGAYRLCNTQAKAKLIQTAMLLAAGMPLPNEKRSSAGQSVVGDNAIQVGSSSGSVTVVSGKRKKSGG